MNEKQLIEIVEKAIKRFDANMDILICAIGNYLNKFNIRSALRGFN
jgi:hypothetical protein